MASSETRGKVFDWQSHAFEKAYGFMTGHRCERPHGPPSGFAACPLCLRVREQDFNLLRFHRPVVGDSAVTIEHAPQRNGRGDLGGLARPSCLTCATCNHAASAAFEGAASAERFVLDAHGVSPCTGKPRWTRASAGGLALPMKHSGPATMADIKSAYLLAFLTLGHRWAFCNSLDAVRASIQVGRADSTCGLRVHLSGPPVLSECVLVIDDPMPCTIVVGQNSQAIVLPRCGPLTDLKSVFALVSVESKATWSVAESHPWPSPNWMQQVVSNGNAPAFHWDLCPSEEHGRCPLHFALLPNQMFEVGPLDEIRAQYESQWHYIDRARRPAPVGP